MLKWGLSGRGSNLLKSNAGDTTPYVYFPPVAATWDVLDELSGSLNIYTLRALHGKGSKFKQKWTSFPETSVELE